MPLKLAKTEKPFELSSSVLNPVKKKTLIKIAHNTVTLR